MVKKSGNMLYRAIKGMKKQEILDICRGTCKCGHSYLEHFNCWLKEKGYTEKIGFLDIETSNLAADFGIVFSYAIKEQGSNKIYGRTVTTEEMHSETYDKILMQELCDDLRKFNRVATYYGSGFDMPFVRARSVYFKLDFPLYKEVYHTDVYYMVKNKLKISRKRLETVCEFLGIPAKHHKMNQTVWLQALGGNPKALKYIWEHNKEDVISTEKVFDRMDNFCMPTRRSI